MPLVSTIIGSPFSNSRSSSRSAAVLRYLETILEEDIQTNIYRLNATELLQMQISGRVIQPSLDLIADSVGIILSSHIYEAAYSGVLKTLLDIMPPHTLRGKIILPLTTGSVLSQMLTGSYSLTPVLNSLGAACVLPSTHILDSQVDYEYQSGLSIVNHEAKKQLEKALTQFIYLIEEADVKKGIWT